MIAPDVSHDIIRVFGPSRALWPEPLAAVIEAHHVRIEASLSMYEICARLAGCDRHIRALLLDPLILTPRDLCAVAAIVRYIQLPIVMLPLLQGASACARNNKNPAILSWQEAAPALASLVTSSRQIHVPRARLPAPAALLPPLTDNRPPPIADIHAENAVTSDGLNRYDDTAIEPLISPQEMAALLGVNE